MTFLPKVTKKSKMFYLHNKAIIKDDCNRFPFAAVANQELLNDFSDTAALIEEMALVITVDTSVAHLAGSIGKETWILLPYAPDFRWMLGRDDTPWYPAAKLFRQPEMGDWDAVINKIENALKSCR